MYTIKLDKSIGIHISKTNKKCIVQEIEYFKDKKELIYTIIANL
ncbi:Adenine-specific methyltransferase (plasmid) [Borrelia miyamotoi FR64b]|uniref:Adenine-specific methyltransferase n=1 Tax=Borrelia miyamotoi FR64b TaxID=1292392 RepID=W5SH53_9SPIR|nr:Adenine-specific methyltransferase [Borrelia miyamotoi FR64b]